MKQEIQSSQLVSAFLDWVKKLHGELKPAAPLVELSYEEILPPFNMKQQKNMNEWRRNLGWLLGQSIREVRVILEDQEVTMQAKVTIRTTSNDVNEPKNEWPDPEERF